MMHPMLLRREEFGLSWCRLVEVVRADWLPPWAAALRVELPDPWVLKDMGASFKGQLQPVSAGSSASGCWQGCQHMCNSTCLRSLVSEPKGVFGCKTRRPAWCQPARPSEYAWRDILEAFC